MSLMRTGSALCQSHSNDVRTPTLHNTIPVCNYHMSGMTDLLHFCEEEVVILCILHRWFLYAEGVLIDYHHLKHPKVPNVSVAISEMSKHLKHILNCACWMQRQALTLSGNPFFMHNNFKMALSEMNARTNCSKDKVSNKSLNSVSQTNPPEVDSDNFTANPFLKTSRDREKERGKNLLLYSLEGFKLNF